MIARIGSRNFDHVHVILCSRYLSVEQYASVEKEGEWFMSHEDFVCRYLQLASPGDSADTIRFLADVADTNKTR